MAERTSVPAQPEPEPTPAEQPKPEEVQHTPTTPLGQADNWAEGVTNVPPGTQLVVADPAAGPTVTQAAPTLEIASPAPLPRPGDENLTRGTADDHPQTLEVAEAAPDATESPTETPSSGTSSTSGGTTSGTSSTSGGTATSP